jgi:hypothetical protein
MKEVIESMNKRPGIIPMSKILDKSAFFQDAPAFAQKQNTEEDSMSNLMEMIQKVGPEKVRQLLQANEYTGCSRGRLGAKFLLSLMMDWPAILQPEDLQEQELLYEHYAQHETRSKTKANTKEYNYM